ncbi:type II toxin-antitoxin system prevent-host-death family antitoxin [Patulibacter sp. NPDC049589]|uniref:type II toxin-antitoxin system Phd/YefM family antitoxin n=1 Tax=Patulibacter sp. NPDC049589 TaxID=3154731 RepID=UPI0034429864
MAREVGIRDLKDHASAVVDAVEAGDTVTVTRRGRAVARLVPIDEHAELRERLAARGVRWSGRRPLVAQPTPLGGDGPTAAETVSADRGPR